MLAEGNVPRGFVVDAVWPATFFLVEDNENCCDLHHDMDTNQLHLSIAAKDRNVHLAHLVNIEGSGPT